MSNLSAESSYLLSSLLSTAADYQPHPQWGDLITEEAELSFTELESYNKAMQTIIIRDLTQQDNGICLLLLCLMVDVTLIHKHPNMRNWWEKIKGDTKISID